jgi:peptidoglycan hydrolase CwlO-like protein
MTIELALLISLISAAFAVYFGVKNNKRADSTDVERKAAEMATINVKLDTIGGDVRDIKYDMTDVKKDVQSLNDRMIVVEQSTKSAHHRIDELVKEGE